MLPLQINHLQRADASNCETRAKAEDALFALLDAAPDSAEVLDLGITFYERLRGRDDAALGAGDLPRAELDAGLAELQARKAALPVKQP